MTEIKRKNILLIDDNKPALSLNIDSSFNAKNVLPIEEVDDESGGDAGIAALSVEQLYAYLQAVFNKLRRQRSDGQRKFGACPISEDPNNLLGKKNASSCGFGESPKSHPLLSATQQFSGIDPKLTAIPAENSEARKQFPEKRLENQHRLQAKLGLNASNSVTLAKS